MAIEDRMFALEESLSWDLEQCLNILWNSWENASASFNAGQYSLYESYIQPALYMWSEFAMSEWPWVDADEYVSMCYEAYDSLVVEQAFSWSIEEPLYAMYDQIEQAQNKAYILEFLESMLF